MLSFNNPTIEITIRILLIPTALATLALCIAWATDGHEYVYTDYDTHYPITAYVFLILSLLLNLKSILIFYTKTPVSKWRKRYTFPMNYWWTLSFDVLLFAALLSDGVVELFIIYGWVNNMGKAMGILCWVVAAGHLTLAVLNTITCCQRRKGKKALKRGSTRLREEENATAESGKAEEEVAVELEGIRKA